VQPPRLLHVSLAHVGHFASLPAYVVATARRAGSAVRTAPFNVSFDRAVSFEHSRGCPLVLRCSQGEAGFADLRRAVAVAMPDAGIRADPSIGLSPHVTLVYNGLPVPVTVLTQPIAWTVRELVLVHSLVGRGRHVHLGRWPLCG
jgi:RNA 2',3'-cyclic 3'-phosphodiesterase